MSEQKFISAANLFGWGQSFNATGKFPLIAKRVWKTYADMLAFVSDTSDVCPAGVVLTVINDTDTKKNGAYFVASCPTLENPNLPVEVQKIGSGETLTAETYEAAVLLATDDNIGSIIYVKSDSEGGTKGPYVVAGAKVIQKLGTTTSTGDISGDVSNLKTDVALLKADENTEGSIAYELKPIKEKINTVEEGAQVNVLEKVYVNDQEVEIKDKSVYLNVPEIVNNLKTDDSTKALSAAQGKVLAEQIIGVQQKLVNIYTYKGSKKTYAELPTDAVAGDVWNVEEAYGTHQAGTNYAWTGTEWDALGGNVDLSNYATLEKVNEVNEALTKLIGVNSEAIGTLNTSVGELEEIILGDNGLQKSHEALEEVVLNQETGLKKIVEDHSAILTTLTGDENKEGSIINTATKIANEIVENAFDWQEVE